MTKPTPAGRDDQLVRDITPVIADALADGQTRPRPLRRNPATWILIAAAALMLFAVVAGYVTLRSNNEKTTDKLDTANGKIGALASQVRGLGGTPVATPTPGTTGARGEPGSTGPTGVTGPAGSVGPALTKAQAAAVFRVMCSQTPSVCQQPISMPRLVSAYRSCFTSGACPAPKNGKDAPAVSDTRLLATFAAYCDQRADRCRGQAGQDGANGVDGKDGAEGPPGPAGKDGENGSDGADAPTITAIDCNSTLLTSGLTFTYQFSDGSQITVTCATGAPSSTPSGTETP